MTMKRIKFLKMSAMFGSVMILPNSRVFGANERVHVAARACVFEHKPVGLGHF